jgi:hypothetical protein
MRFPRVTRISLPTQLYNFRESLPMTKRLNLYSVSSRWTNVFPNPIISQKHSTFNSKSSLYDLSKIAFFVFHTLKLILMLCIYSYQPTCLALQDNTLWTITCQSRLLVLHFKKCPSGSYVLPTKTANPVNPAYLKKYPCGPLVLPNKKRKKSYINVFYAILIFSWETSSLINLSHTQ